MIWLKFQVESIFSRNLSVASLLTWNRLKHLKRSTNKLYLTQLIWIWLSLGIFQGRDANSLRSEYEMSC